MVIRSDLVQDSAEDLVEKVVINQATLGSRPRYQPNFLGSEKLSVPLPVVPQALASAGGQAQRSTGSLSQISKGFAGYRYIPNSWERRPDKWRRAATSLRYIEHATNTPAATGKPATTQSTTEGNKTHSADQNPIGTPIQTSVRTRLHPNAAVEDQPLITSTGLQTALCIPSLLQSPPGNVWRHDRRHLIQPVHPSASR